MSPWLEASESLVMAAGGTLLGAWFSRLQKPYWLLGYFIPFAVIMGYSLVTRIPQLVFVPPFSWMLMGRSKLVVLGFVITMVLTTPLLKLPRRRDRLGVSLIMVLITLTMSVWPCLAPAFCRGELARLATTVDEDGICRQGTDYTCGPASAVTALRRLGFSANEGELAILAGTAPSTGTPPDILAVALENRYGPEGLVAEYRAFKSIDELRGCGLVLAVVKFNLLMDHYVTVLDVNDREVTVGDPLTGVRRYSHPAFAEEWRFVGVVLGRRAAK